MASFYFCMRLKEVPRPSNKHLRKNPVEVLRCGRCKEEVIVDHNTYYRKLLATQPEPGTDFRALVPICNHCKPAFDREQAEQINLEMFN